MSLLNVPLLGMLREKMVWLQHRQNVLAENVANADTPNYEARDLKPLDFDAMVAEANRGMATRTTRAAHFEVSGSGSTGRMTSVRSPDTETSPTGNSVVLEDQMMKVAETQMDYQVATSLYTKSVGLLRMALGGQR